MPADKIQISKADIKQAEKIILPAGKFFDDERIAFIKDLRTLDLQAVPGSGKTTALLAKLLILDDYLPFPNGSGILVLSHTNTAIDGIKNTIGKHCSNIFNYPNFIGTIQSFVDEFLAKPYYSQFFNRKIFKIDDGIFEEVSGLYYDRMPNNAAKNYLNRKNNSKEKFQSLRFDSDLNITVGISDIKFLKAVSNSTSYKQIVEAKFNILESGILHFDDAYFLAEYYLQKIPHVKKILQNRFTYVFIDEMQDMSIHQYQILENIFYDNGKSSSIYQRIGDKNQAIYGGDVKAESCWTDRNLQLNIKGSQRLSPNIAEVVKYFGLEFIEIAGNNKNNDGSDIKIDPHIILYDDNNQQCKVIQKFVTLIREFQNSGKIPIDSNNPVKAIAWRKENNEEHKTALRHYCPCFLSDEVRPKVLYDTLESYLYCYNKEKRTLEAIRKNILNALIHILRLEEIKDNLGRFYTKKNLMQYLKENKEQDYELFNQILYKWCIATIQNKINPVLIEIRSYVDEFINLFESTKSCVNSKPFVFSNMEKQNNKNNSSIYIKCKDCELDGKKIEINTIHSAKGETHTATLYLESFYSRGYGNYESERLRSQFNKQTVNNTLHDLDSNHDIIKQSSKMVYVGFSRPTHLLCFAVHKDRFEKYLNQADSNGWKIIEIN